MKISVITITCRQNPRLAEMARTLAATQQRVVKDEVELVWIVVDELDPNRVYQTMEAEFGGRNLRGFGVAGVPTPPTEHRSGPDRAVAHNTARNAGLALAFANASADYIVMLNDCNIVSMDWAAVVRDCALKGVGWRCKTDVIADMPVPADGLVQHKGHHDLLRPVPVMTVAGACWGAPAKYFYAINGFDTAYDGQRKGNDVDAIVRMSRMGLQFVTTARAYTLQLRRTKIDDEVTTRKDVYAGARNSALLNQLIRDKQRRLPTIANHFTLGVAPVAPPAPPDGGVVQPPVPGDSRGGQHAAPVVTNHITDCDLGPVLAEYRLDDAHVARVSMSSILDAPIVRFFGADGLEVGAAGLPAGMPTAVLRICDAVDAWDKAGRKPGGLPTLIGGVNATDGDDALTGALGAEGVPGVLIEGEAADDYLDDLPGPGLD